MKRLLLGLLFSGIFSCAVAQSAVCLPQLKALPDTDQLLKRGEWTVEFNNLGIPVYSGLTHLNGAYTYRVTPWLLWAEAQVFSIFRIYSCRPRCLQEFMSKYRNGRYRPVLYWTAEAGLR